jgi:hypothetical protein
MDFGENPLIPVQFRVNQFAFFSSPPSQTGSRIEPGDLLLPQCGDSAQIHLGIGMEFLCNVPPNTAHEGYLK